MYIKKIQGHVSADGVIPSGRSVCVWGGGGGGGGEGRRSSLPDFFLNKTAKYAGFLPSGGMKILHEQILDLQI